MIERDRDTDGNGSLDERLYALQDANYNVTAVVDSGGNVVERFLYDPYGKQTVLDANWQASAAAYSFTQGFQGGFVDPITGKIHFGARDYDPNTMRWLQVDPIGYPDGMNRYEMERSNPVNRVDPLGLWRYQVNGPYFSWDSSNNTAYAMFTHEKAPGWMDRWIPGAAPIDLYDWFTTFPDHYKNWYPLAGVTKGEYDTFLSQGKLPKCKDAKSDLLTRFQLDRMTGVERALVEGINNVDVTAGPLAMNGAILVVVGTAGVVIEVTAGYGTSALSHLNFRVDGF